VLLDAALAYADRTTYPLLVQWTLLEGERLRRKLANSRRGSPAAARS
jgi:hypothetical protein